MKTKVLPLLAILVLAFGFCAGTLRVGAQFNQNNIIDDAVFNDYASMDVAQINTFLNSKTKSCISVKNGFSDILPTGYNPANKFIYDNNKVSAGQIIFTVAQVYKVNPKVIISTLEKESSVVTGGASYGCNYINTAMGYDCPDNDNCPMDPATESGFSKQVTLATWSMKFSQQRALGNYNWSVISGNWNHYNDPSRPYYGDRMTEGLYKKTINSNFIYYDGMYIIDGTSVKMGSGATAAFYNYTPHFHGNQLFTDIYENWFGALTGEGFELATAYQSNGDLRQWVVYKGQRHLVPNEDVLRAWGLDKVTLRQWTGEYLGSHVVGSEMSRLMRPTGTPDVYFVDNTRSFKINSPEMLSAWGFNPSSIIDVPNYLAQLPTNSGNLSYSIREDSVSNGPVYLVDGGTARQYGSKDILVAWEGDLFQIVPVSTAYLSQMLKTPAISSTKITSGVAGSTEYQVVAGQKLPETYTIAQLYPGIAQAVSTATINRLRASEPASQFIKSNVSNTVYMIDSGQKHLVPNPNILRAWGIGLSPPINTVTSAALALINTGTEVDGYVASTNGSRYIMDGRKIQIPPSLQDAYITNKIYYASEALMSLAPDGGMASGLIKGFNTPGIYLADGDRLLNITSPNQLSMWSPNKNITIVSEYILEEYDMQQKIGTFVTNGTQKYIIDSGKKHLVTPQAESLWSIKASPVLLGAATLDRYESGDSITGAFRDSKYYYLVDNGSAYATVDMNIAKMWNINNSTIYSDSLRVELLNLKMLAPFARSSTDLRLFVPDGGTLYYLNPEYARNFGLSSSTNFSTVNPSNYEISNWDATVIYSGVNNYSNYYVIDNGGKRNFPNPESFVYWTNSGSTGRAVSSGLLNILPSRGYIDRAVRGSDNKIYDVKTDSEGLRKRWITNPAKFTSDYGRYENVSDNLLSTITSSPNIY